MLNNVTAAFNSPLERGRGVFYRRTFELYDMAKKHTPAISQPYPPPLKRGTLIGNCPTLSRMSHSSQTGTIGQSQ